MMRSMGDAESQERRRHRLGDMRQDLRLAGRALARKPGWTAVGVVTLMPG